MSRKTHYERMVPHCLHAHMLGIPTTSTMLYGHVEILENNAI
jgi:2-iminoacetate synthase ThiH